RVLEVRRQAAVARHRGPPVSQYLHCRLARVHHRLDREHHAFRQPRAAPRLAVVRHLRLLVHPLADAVPDELAHDRKPVRLDALIVAGYPWYPLNAGTAPAVRIRSSAISSSSAVVTPGATRPVSSVSTSPTRRPTARIFSSSAADRQTITAARPAARRSCPPP